MTEQTQAQGTSALVIRPFESRDQAATRRLVLAGLGDHFGSIDESRNPDLDDIQRHYVEPGHLFVLAERNGELIGAGGLVNEGPNTGRLVRMSVDKAHRGQGLGRRLVNHLIESALARGHTRLLVETNDDWHDAIGLYRACGFIEEARRDGDVHLVMNLTRDARL